MALPANVSFGTVTGTFLLASADSPADQDRDPEGNPATDLQFTFAPDLTPAIARDPSATPPTMFALLPVTATVGQDGSLLGPDGAPGVRLVASTNPQLQPNGWTWNVKLKSSTFPALSFSFQLDPNATVDLSTVLQVPANPGSTLNAWLQAVADAQAARDAAIAAAAAGGLVSWAPNTPYVSGQHILSPTGDIIQANSAFTSGATYSASNWTVVVLGAASTSGTYSTLAQLAANPDQLAVGALTRSATGAVTSFACVWPDGSTGTFTGTESTTTPGAVDSYTVTKTKGGTTVTFTQPSLTRDSTGAVTNRPAITAA